ncbi:hypothetical protein Q3G72_004031 [Acer saccharum]|nr:hypothetical protein Q3G72_004031 [Acer saccharum]
MIRRIHVPWRAGPADQHPLARSAARLRAGLGPHRVLRGPDLIRPSFLGRPYGPALLGLELHKPSEVAWLHELDEVTWASSTRQTGLGIAQMGDVMHGQVMVWRQCR